MAAVQPGRLQSLWTRWLSRPRASHVLAGWVASSNSRLLSRALCRFRYSITSSCFSTISSRLETVLQNSRYKRVTRLRQHSLVLFQGSPQCCPLRHTLLSTFPPVSSPGIFQSQSFTNELSDFCPGNQSA